MHKLIREIIAKLKLRVRNNRDIISKHSEMVEKIKADGLTKITEKDYREYIETVDRLIQENQDLETVLSTLEDFFVKYHNTPVIDEDKPIIDIYSITDPEEIFQLTVRRVVSFDEKHPFYNDYGFIEEMIEYHKKREEYERCQELQTILKLRRIY